MKINMKKLAAWMLALLLVFQMVPVMAAQETSEGYTPEYKSFREQLEITADPDIISVGDTVTLNHTDGYDNLTWKSGKEEVATVENGVVTAIAPGTVKITAKEGDFSDAIIIRVIEAPVAETGSVDETEGEEEQDTESVEKMVVVITTAKEKLTYDGQEHEVGFTAKAVNNKEEFNEENVKINPDKVITAKDCGITKADYTADDFTYEGSDNVVFEVSEGWIQIKPAEVTVTADDKEMMVGDPNPEFTVSIVGLVDENDQIKIDEYETDAKAEAGVYNIFPVGQTSQENYKVSFKPGKLTVEDMPTLPLYNLAEINGTYYRLAKTTIRTNKVISENLGKKLEAGTYQVDDYDFANLPIEIGGKTYLYSCDENAEEIFNGANYYTASFMNMDVCKQKIGGMNGNNPRWLIPEDQRYNDPNATDSIHRNFKITLTENKSKPVDQEAFNMLSVNGNMNYYRLRKTAIKAKDAAEVNRGTELKSGEYSLEKYDFTNVVIDINGEEYKYSDRELEGEYDSYFTVEFERVVKEDLVNKNANWYNNENGWLDGAFEQYGNQPNMNPGYHVNYKATTHKGTKRDTDQSVTISSSWPEDKPAYFGTMITLTAHLTGFEGVNCTYQWMYSTDQENWTAQPGATEETFTYELNEATAGYTWKVVVDEVK